MPKKSLPIPNLAEMTHAKSERERFDFLEGTRGIAAMLIVFLHFCSAFFPSFAQVSISPADVLRNGTSYTPWYFLIHGGLWVSIFFLMSGFVLTPSFLSVRYGIVRKVYKRFIRLFFPVAASILFSLALVHLFPPEKNFIYHATQSTWVMNLFLNPLNFWSIAKDIFLDSMLTGYQIGSIFKNIIAVSPLSISMNPPIWTLHAELWGSLLTLVMTWLYVRLWRPLFWVVFATIFIATSGSFCTIFLLGFLAYLFRHILIDTSSKRASWAGAIILLCGLVIDSLISPSVYTLFIGNITLRPLVSVIAVVLVLSGILISPAIRSALSCRAAMFLGKLSFSIYLVHFPILFTLGFATFRNLSQNFPFWVAVTWTAFLTGAVTIFSAILFERFIDRRAVVFSRKSINRWLCADESMIAQSEVITRSV